MPGGPFVVFGAENRQKTQHREHEEKLTEEHRGVDVLGWLDRFLG